MNTVNMGAIVGQSWLYGDGRSRYDLAGITMGRYGEVFRFNAEAVRMFGDEEEYTYHLMLGIKPNKSFYFELFHDRSAFEIVNLDSLMVVNSYGGTVDWYLGRGDITAGYIRQEIGVISKDIYLANASFSPHENVGLVVLNKAIRSSERSPIFFSPLEFNQHMAGLFIPMVSRGQNHVLRPQAVAGAQWDGYTSYFAYDLSLRGRGWFTNKLGYEVLTSYNNVRTEDQPYSNFYSSVTLIWRLH